ncbi:SycD/LcrH family type III secretion system chaperone [Pseudomonas typographi]|uniref:SycD/LcrH family type III secretion system chaperone n=1 Tax=Pseudomonas typographi TaxID=2715964 RepID=A0ABR7Z2M1_9PSED|nr:SycD/LcrH family type III secretion system chaperone [Pseudomonas typographi]MBD1552392.1 SycD/LcrH family type III secretion system chaperone [Pseudomonas typographi]MBD1587212.1 SycD/LcrH family type III secretion system chaperone [Pseudomonas typographi]MBD1599526.1 SycD/LcrH family type III secretion system chaperone [Pseudomonas typographi]
MNESTTDELVDVTAEMVLALMRGEPMSAVVGLSQGDMDEMYAHAHRFYQRGQLNEAERFFHFLCIYDMRNPDYWFGLAAVKQLKGEHQNAIDLYVVAFTQGRDDYRPMFYTGQCHLALGRLGKAKLCFEYCRDGLPEGALRDQALGYLKALEEIEADHSED